MAHSLQGFQEERLIGNESAELWAVFAELSRRQYGRGASLSVELRNTGARPLQVVSVDFAWENTRPRLLELPQGRVVNPGTGWEVLNPRSYAEVLERAKDQGKGGFGVDSTVHDVTVRLEAPEPIALSFQVCWGFATLEHDLGFFLSALD